MRTLRFLSTALALLGSAACTVNASGAIPCNDDSNCPGDYPQCIDSTGSGGSGRCTESVSGTPVVSSASIDVSPVSITGGLHPGLSLTLPSIGGNKNLVRKVTLEIDSGGAKEALTLSGGAALTLANLGTTVNVDAPTTLAADNKTYNITLTVSNEPSSSASATATGTFKVIPAPALASGTVLFTPPSILGGLQPALTVALPALATSSPSSTISGVSFSISNCGSGAVAKSGGSPVGVADLGTNITIASPSSVPSDKKTCSYTLSVSNTAATPATTTATGSLSIGTGAGAVAKFGGDFQYGQAGAALSSQFVVKVTDVNGLALQNFPIAWAVASGGGTLSGTTSVTDVNGQAVTTLTLGAAAVLNTVTATATGFAPLTFTATGAGAVVKVSGDAQFGKISTALANQFVVKVTDFSGAVLPDFPVAWAVASGGGSLGGTTIVTDAGGLAVTTLTPGAAAVANTVTATIPGFSALTFSATAAGAISKFSGDGQTGQSGVALPSPLVAKVTDFSGAPLAGFPVVWAVTAGGGSLSSTTTTTDAGGQVVTTLTPGAAANTVTATAPGFTAISFSASAAGGVLKFSGDNQFNKTSTALSQFVVKVTDAGGAALAGYPVAWAVTAGGGSLSGTTTSTDAGGFAVATLTTGSTAVTNTVTATANALPAVTFTATAAGSRSKLSGDNQFGQIGVALGNQFVLKVLDGSGSALQGFPVTFAVATGGGSLSATTTTTDVNGQAVTTLTPGLSATTNTVNATAAGFAALTFTATAAGSVTKVSGDAQFGKTGAALANQFVFKVMDFNGGALSGFPVAWAIASGGGSLASTTTTTDGSGLVHTTLTPGTAAITNTVTATATGFSASTFTATAAASVSKVSGDTQFGKTGTALASQFVFKVMDFNGLALPGFPVAWAVTLGGGSLSGTTTTTDASGLAVTTLTPGTGAINNTVTATATGFTAQSFTAIAAKAAIKLSGDGQFGKVSTALGSQFVVKVTDFNDANLSGFPVAWAVTAGGGSLSGTTSTTAANGQAVTLLTLATAVTNTVTATLPGFTVLTFTATGANAIAKDSGDVQFGKNSTALANPFVVKVTDTVGTGVPNYPVVWAVTVGGGSLSGTTSTTDASGFAQTTLTPGPTATSHTVTATATGFTAVSFTATAAASVAKFSGDTQSGKFGTALGNPFVVKATTSGGAALAGFPVAWAVTGGGGSLSGTTTTTDASGFAQTTLTLGAAGGTNTVTATSPSFAVNTFTAAGANTIALNGGDGQTGTTTQALATALSVLVSDGSAAPVSGVTVTWAATVGGGSITATSVTNGSGIASATATLGAAAGGNTFTATITGLTPVSFSATAVLVPVFSGSMTVVPQAIVAGTSTPLGLLQFSLPGLSQGVASSIAMTVTPTGGTSTAVKKTGNVDLAPSDLTNTISVDPPASTNPENKVYTYSLTATNSAGGSGTPATATVTTYPAGATTLANQRLGSAAVALPNGKVLIIGGGTKISGAPTTTAAGTCTGATATVDIYDPAAGTVTAGPSMPGASRCLHTATFISGSPSKIYVIGGADSKNIDVFTYDPSNGNGVGTWLASGFPQMNTKRIGHAAMYLSNVASGSNQGSILIAGGYVTATGSIGNGINTIELFTPGSTPSVLYSGSGTHTLSFGRGEPSAAYAGKWVCITGGYDPNANLIGQSVDCIDSSLAVDAGAQVVNTSSGTIGGFANPGIARFAHQAVGLSTTSILLVGGIDSGGTVTGQTQKYTLDSSTGLITAASAAGSVTGRARFPLLPADPSVSPTKYIVFGGATAISTTTAADTPGNSIELITASNLANTSYGTLATARNGASVAAASVGSNNSLFVVAGGATSTNLVQVIAGP